jgi:hypothetical protein
MHRAHRPPEPPQERQHHTRRRAAHPFYTQFAHRIKDRRNRLHPDAHQAAHQRTSPDKVGTADSWGVGAGTTLTPSPRTFTRGVPTGSDPNAERPTLVRSKLGCVGDFALSSDAFAHGDEVPRRHTCEGDDLSPALSWSEPPAGTRALALIVDDPDAPVGTFTHWLAWNIDPAAGGLGEGESAPAEGRNDFGIGGWSGPCPPPRTARTATSCGCTPSTPSSTSASAPGGVSSSGRSPATCS